ncbi:hypothetical protein GOP47_0021826 [Adiantum capillus-veneris]|uniref:Uncharacterized protein n=1 Tax=Adiantum capillus-veneris TaxID=13818 RepID=A0A9D4Z6K5_ADICA|nr:hypothetical protein GOP47_0021826 [Adiantum capillus-veneris]
MKWLDLACALPGMFSVVLFEFCLLLLSVVGAWPLISQGVERGKPLCGIFVYDKVSKCVEIWPIAVVACKAWRLTSRKKCCPCTYCYPKSGTSKRECVRIDASESSASTPTTSRKRSVYSEPNFAIQPSLSKGKVQACSAQVGCSKAQKAKMDVVKIERHDALIDTEEDEVKANPFPQQEPSIEEHNVPFLHITDLSDITPRFAIEGFVRIEGSTIKTKNKADGGTSPFSLYLDATSIVTCIASFPIRLSFYPEMKIRFFLDEAASAGLSGAKSYLGTLAFVVIESESFEMYTNSTRGELLVDDGSTPKDRATLTFVNDHKEEYKSIKRDIDNGEVKTFVARNVGAFLGHENTLSVLDLTILVPVHSKHLQSDLLQTYKTQVESLGYGKQRHYVSFANRTRFIKRWKVFSVSLAKRPPQATRFPSFKCRSKPREGPVISAQLVGLIVDEVLALGKTFQSLYSKSPIVAREIFASKNTHWHVQNQPSRKYDGFLSRVKVLEVE